MRRIGLSGIVAALLLIAGRGEAQTQPTFVFTAVDAVGRRSASSIILTGLLEGASEPTTKYLYAYTNPEAVSSCERGALMAMSKPGQYRLEVYTSSGNYIDHCRLARVTP